MTSSRGPAPAPTPTLKQDAPPSRLSTRRGRLSHRQVAALAQAVIAASQGYESKASAEKGIEAIKTHAPNAKVEDHSG
ncbi:MAG: YegP family protein [Mycobacterium sp.]|uniref:YegP family protein n=1 Tax=Mycobacterium sp. TaxID=1785 RepID=UPI003BB503BB